MACKKKVKGIKGILNVQIKKNVSLMLTLWKFLEIQQLAYGSQPLARHLIVELETLQKLFLNGILFLSHLN